MRTFCLVNNAVFEEDQECLTVIIDHIILPRNKMSLLQKKNDKNNKCLYELQRTFLINFLSIYFSIRGQTRRQEDNNKRKNVTQDILNCTSYRRQHEGKKLKSRAMIESWVNNLSKSNHCCIEKRDSTP